MCLSGGEAATKSHGQVRRHSWSNQCLCTGLHREYLARGANKAV